MGIDLPLRVVHKWTLSSTETKTCRRGPRRAPKRRKI